MAKGSTLGNTANRATTKDKLNNKSGGSIGDKLTNIADRAFKKGGIGSGKSPSDFGKLRKDGANLNAVAKKTLGNKTPMGPK